jgi:hypothetical protein
VSEWVGHPRLPAADGTAAWQWARGNIEALEKETEKHEMKQSKNSSRWIWLGGLLAGAKPTQSDYPEPQVQWAEPKY